MGAIAEIVRVLASGGRGLIYVWAMEQQRGKKKSTYLKQNKANRHEEQQEESVINDHERGKVKEQNCENKVYLDGQGPEGNLVNMETSTSGAAALPVHINRTEFVQQDMLVPWKLKAQKKKEALCERKGKHKKEPGSCCRCRCNRHHANKASGDSQNIEQKSETAQSFDDNRKDDQYKPKPDNGPEQVFHRFYHVFKQGELDRLCKQLKVEIVKSYYDEGNWCIIFQKVS